MRWVSLGDSTLSLAVTELPSTPDAASARGGELLAVVCDSVVELRIHLDPDATSPDAQSVASALEAELARLLDQGAPPAREILVPSDFPLAALDASELDTLLERCEERGQELDALVEVLPLSSTQLGMVYHGLYEPGSQAYFQQLWFDLEGTPSFPALRAASEQILAEYDVFRLSVEWDGLAEPHQLVWARIDAPWEEVDLRSLDAAAQARAVEELLVSSRHHGFDVSTPPLHRWQVVRRGDTTYTLVFSFHHLILDGWSSALVLTRFFDLYQAYASGESPDVRPGPPYRDFIRLHRAQDLGRARAFWTRRLAGLASSTPVSSTWSWGESGRPSASESFDEVELALTEAETGRLTALGRDLRVTPSTLIYAAWGLTLGSYVGRRDVLFGATVSGRSPEMDDVERRVGLLINTVPVRVVIRDDERVGPWLVAFQRSLAEQVEMEGTPLPVVQACSEVPTGRPLLQSIVVYENFPVDEHFSGSGVAFGGQVSGARFFERTSYPLTLAAVPAPGQPIRLRLIFDGGRIDRDRARSMLASVGALLRRFPREREATLRDLAPRSEPRGEASRAEAPRGSTRPSPLDRPLLEAIEQTATEDPHRVALESGGMLTSYAELQAQVQRIARALRARGLGADDVVGVCVRRSPDAIAAVLGVLRAGAAYLPLDPSDPPPRIADSLSQARARLLVTTGDLAERGGPYALPTLRLDADAAALRELPSDGSAPAGRPEDLAYVISTSGSSGRPKPVGVERRALEHYARAAALEYGLTSRDRVLQLASLAFDASVEEIFPTLWVGATLVLRADEMLDSPTVFVEGLAAREISVASLPTAYWHELCAALGCGAPAPTAPLRLLVIGGEAARARALEQWRQAAPASIRLVNTYGPTEATVVATWCDLGEEPAVDPLPIGRPVPGVRCVIGDPGGPPLPAGAPGELYLGGPGLARGYLDRPRLTSERFVPDRESGPGERLYRTGDIVCLREDGCLQYLGRADDQLKIRGFRVEPGEIERHVARHRSVSDCGVVAIGAPEARQLVAFVVAREPISPDAIRACVRDQLPAAFVPDRVYLVEALPRTTSGKLDRAALARPLEALAPREAAEPRAHTPAEELMLALWSQALEVERVRLDDSFFDLGGNSISGARLMFAVEHAFGVRVPLRRLFDAGTPGRLTRMLDDRRWLESGEGMERDLASDVALPDDVRPRRVQVATAPRAVLLTGATGFVGSFLLTELLEESADRIVYALVRAADAAEARVRIERNLARYRLPGRHLERVVPVVGELAAPGLGLDEESARRLRGEIGAIYHAAALVNRATYDALARTNVGGVVEILRLACSGAPKVLHYVSSMGVVAAASDLETSREVHETSVLEDWRSLPRGYLQTKWVAEGIVREAAARGLQVAVYRPGLVAGSSLTGASSADHAPSRVILSLLELGVVPATGDEYLRVISVDHLARSIVYLAGQPESIGRVHHVFDPERVSLSDLSAWMGSAGYPLQEVSRQEWIQRALAQGQRSALFRALADALLEADAVKDEIIWANDATLEALEASGIPWGGLSEERFHATLRYWQEHGILPLPPPPGDAAKARDARYQ